MLRFSFIVSRWANYYFFIQNLANWHFSSRSEYNHFWRTQVNLTKRHNDLLEQFRVLHQKYPFGEHYLGKYFFMSKHPLEAVKKALPKNDGAVVKKVFDSLEPLFKKVYQVKRLLLWQKALTEIVNKNNPHTEIYQILSSLYGKPDYSLEVQVFLLISAPGISAGQTGFLGDNTLLLEINGKTLQESNQVQGVLWHEVVHLVFETDAYRKFVVNIVGSREIASKVSEAIVSSLFPNGVLGKIFLHNEFKENHNGVFMMMQQYINQKKPIDTIFIKKIEDILKK